MTSQTFHFQLDKEADKILKEGVTKDCPISEDEGQETSKKTIQEESSVYNVIKQKLASFFPV